MTHEDGTFGDHVVEDEPLHLVAAGRFVSDTAERPVSVGLTDRRLLCAFDEDDFAAVAYDGITSVRSRERTSRTVRNGARLLIAAGAYLAVNALFGLIVYAFVAGPGPGRAAVFLSSAVVGGFAVAELVRRRRGFDALRPTSRSAGEGSERRSMDSETARNVAVAAGGLAAGLIGALALVAVVAYVSIIVVPALVLLGLGGLALLDVGLRGESDDAVELVEERENEVTLTTADGTTLRVVVDGDVGVSSTLNRLAFTDRSGPELGDGSRNAPDHTENGELPESTV